MKIAFTSAENKLLSSLDDHFGRCSFIVIYDTSTGGLEFLPNPHKEMIEGAGTELVRLIASRGVSKIVTARLGRKIKPLLDVQKIQIIIYKNKEKSIQDLINIINHIK